MFSWTRVHPPTSKRPFGDPANGLQWLSLRSVLDFAHLLNQIHI